MLVDNLHFLTVLTTVSFRAIARGVPRDLCHKSSLKQEIRSVELEDLVCPMQLFHLKQVQRGVHPVQNLLLCTKFHENLMIFHRDMAIYRFSKWRTSAILELFYHYTRPPMKSLLLAAAACQISCQSDTQI